jgi:hypothetical protein
MDEHDWHRRVEAVREQVETASIGLIIGASLMVFTPVSITQASRARQRAGSDLCAREQ